LVLDERKKRKRAKSLAPSGVGARPQDFEEGKRGKKSLSLLRLGPLCHGPLPARKKPTKASLFYLLRRKEKERIGSARYLPLGGWNYPSIVNRILRGWKKRPVFAQEKEFGFWGLFSYRRQSASVAQGENVTLTFMGRPYQRGRKETL